MTQPGFFQGTGMPDPGWWEALWPDPAKVLSQCGVEPGMAVVDLCSGDGWFTLQIAKVARHVVAIDIDRRLLEMARIRLAENGVSNGTYLEADAYDIARLVSEPVDHVFLANAFHGVPDKPRLSRAIHAVLKPAGLFAIVNWHARPREETTVLGEPQRAGHGAQNDAAGHHRGGRALRLHAPRSRRAIALPLRRRVRAPALSAGSCAPVGESAGLAKENALRRAAEGA